MFLKINLNSINLKNSVSSVGGIEPRLLKNNEARGYYDACLKGKTPSKEFTLQGTVPTIIGCILYGLVLGIFISGWFLIIGTVAFILAQIVFIFAFTYFAAYTHNVHWYEETNQYAFILKFIFSKKEEITIYKREPYDYISIYKILGPSGPYSPRNRLYAIRAENQDDIMDLHSMQYDYKITEFSEIFGFEVKDESKE